MSYSNIGHETNLRLSQNAKISLNTFKTKLGSLNTLVIGATGEGKSRYIVRPIAYSMPVDPRPLKDKDGKEYFPKASFVFTDPKGELFNDTAGVFKANGYDVKVLNLVNMSASDCYNPFKYIYFRDDVESALEILIDGIVEVAQGQGGNQDPHWKENAKNVLNSIAYYVYYELPAELQNFDTINKMIKLFKMGDDDTEAPIDKLYKTCQQFPLNDHPAIKWRNKVSARGGELSSIISSTDTAIKLWTSDSIKNMMSADNINLDTIGDKPTALYVITPVSNGTYDNMIAVFYNQLFETLMYKAESVYHNKGLPHHVFVVQDEFANTGKIPNYDKKIATFRSCNISSIMIVQSPNQLKAMYDKEYQSIADNAHITIFLGNGGHSIDSQDNSAAGYMSNALGKTTIRTEGQSLSYQNQNIHQIFEKPSLSTSINIQVRDLMTTDEVKRLPADECLILIKEQFPIRDKKTDLDTCLNYGSDLYTTEIIGHDSNGKETRKRVLKDAFKADINKDKNTLISYQEGREKCKEIDILSRKNLFKKIIKNSQFNEIKNKSFDQSEYIAKDRIMYSVELSEFIEKNIDEIAERLSKNIKLIDFYVPDELLDEYTRKQEEKEAKNKVETNKGNEDTVNTKKEENTNNENTVKTNVVTEKPNMVNRRLRVTRQSTKDINNSLDNKINELSDTYEKFKSGEISTEDMRKYMSTAITFNVSDSKIKEMMDKKVEENKKKEDAEPKYDINSNNSVGLADTDPSNLPDDYKEVEKTTDYENTESIKNTEIVEEKVEAASSDDDYDPEG